MGVINQKNLHHAILSNSDFVYVNALDQTDICGLGLCLPGEQYWIHQVKMLPIIGCEPVLTVGCVFVEGQKLSAPAEKFVQLLNDRIS